MTENEAANFIKAIVRRYPSIETKAMSLAPDWIKVFVKLDRDDCYQALLEIYEGEEEKPFPDDWPAGIAKICRGYMNERAPIGRNEQQFKTISDAERLAAQARMMERAMCTEYEPIFKALPESEQIAFAKEWNANIYDMFPWGRWPGWVWVTLIEAYKEYLTRQALHSSRDAWNERSDLA